MPNLPHESCLRAILATCLTLGLGACDGEGPTPASPAGAGQETPQGAASALPGSADPARKPGATRSGPALDARLELEVVGKPEGLLTIDLDGDGKDELFVLSRTPGRLSLFTRLPQGWKLTARHQDLVVDDYSLGPVALGVGTPKPLIGLVSRSTRKVALIDPSPGAGEVVAATLTLTSAPRSIGSGSLADGRGERLVIATAAAELVHWNGESAPHTQATGMGEVSCMLLLADRSAVLLGDRGQRKLAMFSARSGERSAEFELEGMPRALLELDLDASGDPELIVAGGDRALWIFGLENEGGPSAWFEGGAPLAYELDRIPLRLARGDVSGDGHDDLIALFFGQLSYRVMSLTTPSPEVARGYAGQAPWDLATGDFDGDGRLDLAFANRGARRVGLLYGDAHGGLRSAERIATGRAPHSLTTLRAGSGGHKSIAVIHSLEDSLAVYSKGAAAWRASPKLPTGPGANHICALDLFGDGEQQLAWTSTDAQGAKLVFSTQPGAKRQGGLPAPIPVGSSASDLVVVDLLGAGATELIACDEEARLIRWLRRDSADRSAMTITTLELPASPTAAVPFTSRGARYLAVTCASSSGGSGLAIVQVRDGTLQLAEYLPSETLLVDITAADVNADGELDLVVLSKPSAMDNGGSVELWLRGESWTKRAAAPTGQRPYAIAASDWNGDGRAEVLVTAQNSHNVGLWFVADGAAGNLRLDRQADLGAGLGPLDLLFEDLDGDGVPEAIIAGAFSDDLSVISRGR